MIFFGCGKIIRKVQIGDTICILTIPSRLIYHNPNLKGMLIMRIYVSPSDQTGNVGVGNYGTEARRMQELSNLLVPMLRASGHTVFGGSNSLNLTQRVAASNSANVDLHIALHSNAAGGTGPETHYNPGSTNGRRLANEILYNLHNIPGAATGRTVKASSFYELSSTTAVACLIEVAFHDNQTDVNWMMSNWNAIANAIRLGVNNY